MKFNLWTLIDTIITSPAWFAGYVFRAYINTFKCGGACYIENVRKYWVK